jgi:hypothetical protein
MAEVKKRFPWWLILCAAVLVPLAAVTGLIETVGRRGTLVGRLDQIDKWGTEWMDEDEFLRILGPPTETGPGRHCFSGEWGVNHRWQDGPASLLVFASRLRLNRGKACGLIGRKDFENEDGHVTVSRDVILWRVRRWAEQAYTAIHGPRR